MKNGGKNRREREMMNTWRGGGRMKGKEKRGEGNEGKGKERDE